MRCLRVCIPGRGIAGVAVALLVFLLDAVAVAQDRPRLILNTEGPGALLSSLRFSANPPLLYAAGLDKTVHVWHVGGKPADPLPTLNYVRTLRWDISRGDHGVIHAMDPSANGVIAIGGHGAYNSTLRAAGGGVLANHLGFFDINRGVLTQALPTNQTIEYVSFTPDGQSLATIDKNDEVLVWTSNADGTWTPRQLRAPVPPTDARKVLRGAVLFVDDQSVVVPEASAGSGLLVFDKGGRRPAFRLPAAHRRGITALARQTGGKRWASADEEGTICLWSGVAAQQPSTLRRGGESQRVALSLAFSPDGKQLLVGNWLDGKQQTVVELWNVDGALRDELITSSGADAVRHMTPVAWSADGRWIAVFLPQAFEVRLYSVASAPEKPLQGQFVSVSGDGHPVRRVAFDAAPGSTLIGFSARLDDPMRAFDLSRPDGKFLPRPPEQGAWRNGDSDAGGWSIEKTVGKFGTTLRGPGGIQSVLNLDRVNQGAYRSHAWIADRQGRTAAIAIGVDTTNGIFIFQLPAKSGERPLLLRHMRDHNAPATTLCTSSDRRFLVSGSDDQTFKVWSLDALFDGWPTRTQWGCDFVPDPTNGLVTVRNVVPAGIIAGRGMVEGDVIVSLSRTRANDPPASILAKLRSPEAPHQEFDVVPQRAGKPRPAIVVRAAWEPLFTFFATKNHEWAAFTPQGYYDSSPLQGDELFGWQQSTSAGNVGREPRVLKAANLQREFEKPEVLRNLLVAGDLEGAFRPLAPPADLTDRSREVIAATPEITLTDPDLLTHIEAPPRNPQGGLAKPHSVSLAARVTFPPGKKPGDYRVSAAIEGRTLPAATANPFDEKTTNYFWKADPPGAYSRIKVTVEEVGKTTFGRQNSVDADVVVTSDEVNYEKPYRLYLLALSAANYQGAWKTLDYPNEDAREFLEEMQAASGGASFIVQKPLRWLSERSVTQDAVTRAIADLRQQVLGDHLTDPDPRSLVVVFLAGHGVAAADDYYFVPSAVKGNDSAALATEAIPWSRFALLFDLPCQKLFLIDTCKSGDIGHLKSMIHPLKRSGCMVFSATGLRADSAEDPIAKHGYFTDALLLGMRGVAGRQFKTPSHLLLEADSHIGLGELIRFTKKEVEARKEQHPQHYPHQLQNELRRLRTVKLVTPAEESR